MPEAHIGSCGLGSITSPSPINRWPRKAVTDSHQEEAIEPVRTPQVLVAKSGDLRTPAFTISVRTVLNVPADVTGPWGQQTGELMADC